jgi:hypothetical protein
MSFSAGCQLKRTKAHMLGLRRDNMVTHNFSVIWKIQEDSRNKPEAKWARKPGDHPRVGAGAPPAEPIRLHLADPASTTFEGQ